MHADDYIRGKLAELGWRAAHHISIPAILSVMFVVKTRVEMAEPKDWLREMKALTYMAHLESEPDIRDPLFLEALKLVDGVYPGDTGEPPRKDIFTNGGLYWWDGTGTPWFGMQNKERVSQVGTLTFWK